MIYDSVFRFEQPAGLKGRPCRIVARPPGRRYPSGMACFSSTIGTVEIEMQDGERRVVSRAGVVPITSKLGRQTIRKIARLASEK